MSRFASWGLALVVTLVAFVLINILSSFLYGTLRPSGKLFVELAKNPDTGSIQITNDMLVSHPYLLYDNAPNYSTHGFKQHNAAGYRGPEIGEKRKIRILVLGGSTTYSWSVWDPQKTWTARLEQMFPPDTVEVIN